MAEVATDILEELDSLQTPHVAYWAIVARRLAYPAYFQPNVPSPALNSSFVPLKNRKKLRQCTFCIVLV
jgi:hypothetical protein